MLGALANSQKVPILATFSPHKKNPFQSGPSIKMIKNRVFQRFVKQPESFMARGVDSAILHMNIDIIPGCWNFSFKIGSDGASDSNR